MTTRALSAVCLITLGWFVAGCSTTPTADKYSGVPGVKQMTPDTEHDHTLLYVKEGASLEPYSKFIVEPVQIYRGPGASWHNNKVTEQTKQELAKFAHDEFVRVLGKKYSIVDQAGPGVLRLKLILTDMEMTTPALAMAANLSPESMVLNLIGSGAGMQASFVGSVTMAGELLDAQSNAVLVAFLTKQAPLAVDATKTLTATGAARAGITEVAGKLKEGVDRAHPQESSQRP